MLKKGHKRKNWTERWFVLRPNMLSYYACEDLVEKKGDIILNEDCCLEVSVCPHPEHSEYFTNLTAGKLRLGVKL